jgi:hypothetical protein
MWILPTPVVGPRLTGTETQFPRQSVICGWHSTTCSTGGSRSSRKLDDTTVVLETPSRPLELHQGQREALRGAVPFPNHYPGFSYQFGGVVVEPAE